ncbi:Maf family protein [Candidatus Sneabacter namystus]|uniref:Nucleoside triphosphate pyrophosphatase n=1 Tax=Candidatus Sneabacter namystus TaxID=2601646 RepID=A0A5C0UKA6_9RICK|nr:Maf family nucleotide pyrophosphatase [Candidatus Sneabacter namystus]QEK39872.1 septum formation protein Maf [Candidatus Sneabacter namystus]
MEGKKRFVLGSSSAIRFTLIQSLLKKEDFDVHPPDIDEEVLDKELPREYVKRIAEAKAEKVSRTVDNEYVICADTAVALGRRILPKAVSDDLVRQCLKQLSGRRHRVYTCLCVIRRSLNADGVQHVKRVKVVESRVRFKRLTQHEIQWYVDSKEGLDKAGGYSIYGKSQALILFLSGSVSGVQGLPLLELKNLLTSVGVDV